MTRRNCQVKPSLKRKIEFMKILHKKNTLRSYFNDFIVDEAKVTVYPATRILSGPFIPNDGMFNAGEEIGMECTVENHEDWITMYQGEIKWMKDNEYITNDDDIRYSIEDNSLVISNLKKTDAGTNFLFGDYSTGIFNIVF